MDFKLTREVIMWSLQQVYAWVREVNRWSNPSSGYFEPKKSQKIKSKIRNKRQRKNKRG